MQYTQHLTIDVFKQEQFQYIHAVQYDHCARQLVITPTANGEKLTIPSTATAVFRCLKHDGTSVVNPATVDAAAGTVTFELTDQALACEGMARADVSIIDGENVISTLTFFVMVEKAPTSSEQIASTNEFLFIAQVAATVEGYTERAETAAENAAISETAAKEAQRVAEEAIEGTDAAITAAAEAKVSAENAANSETVAEAAKEAAEAARDEAVFFSGENAAFCCSVTIPPCRIRGDVNGDGLINANDNALVVNGTGSAGLPYYNKNLATLFPDGNIPMDYLAADVTGDGWINSADASAIISSGFKAGRYGQYAEVTGNWICNPNYTTEEWQFYTDLSVDGVKTTSGGFLVIDGAFRIGDFKVTCPSDGVLRLWIKTIVNDTAIGATLVFGNKTSGFVALATGTIDDGKENKTERKSGNLTTSKWVEDWEDMDTEEFYTVNETFETNYPYLKYEFEFECAATTAEEYDAFVAAKLVRHKTSNRILALGTKPTIKLPIKIKVTPK